MIFKKIICVSGILLALCFVAYADTNFGAKKLTIAKPSETLKLGEKIVYKVEWLGVPIGSIDLNVKEIVKVEGTDCYHVVAHARPNRFFVKFYNVEYTVDTYIDTKTHLTQRFEKIRRIKDQYQYVGIDFDHRTNEVRYRESGSAPTMELSLAREKMEACIPSTLKILKGTQDLFSSLYHLRLMDIEPQRNYNFDIYYERRNWPITAKVGTVFVKDIRRQGSFPVFLVSLDSDLSKFIFGKSAMSVYFMADSRRIPVEFNLKTSIGPIKGRIYSITY